MLADIPVVATILTLFTIYIKVSLVLALSETHKRQLMVA